jgi:hypothetical protein
LQAIHYMKSYLLIAAMVLLTKLTYAQYFNINGQPIDPNGNYEAKVWEGTIIFKEGKNYGMKTTEGKVLLDPVYHEVRHFGYGIIGARKRMEGFSDYDHETKEPYMFYKATGEPISSKGYFLHDDYDGFSYGGMVIADDLSTHAKRE